MEHITDIYRLPKKISNRWLCHIDVTNVCESKFGCAYCTRYVRHMRPDQLYFMPVDYFENAVKSLVDFPGMIGIMGGLPTKHPKFSELCKVLRDNISSSRLELWTSGEREFEKYSDDISSTFGHIAKNDHNEKQVEVCEHQVTTLALSDIIEDKKLINSLIRDCWVLDRWCPNISYKGGNRGAFVCELMSGMDEILLSSGMGDKGIDFVSDRRWWDREVDDYEYIEQRREYCRFCSMCVPMNRQLIKNDKELVSETVNRLLRNNDSPCLKDSSKIEVFHGKITRDSIGSVIEDGWEPHKFRGDLPNGEA